MMLSQAKALVTKHGQSHFCWLTSENDCEIDKIAQLLRQFEEPGIYKASSNDGRHHYWIQLLEKYYEPEATISIKQE
jgi:hypothetical protein